MMRERRVSPRGKIAKITLVSEKRRKRPRYDSKKLKKLRSYPKDSENNMSTEIFRPTSVKLMPIQKVKVLRKFSRNLLFFPRPLFLFKH